MTISTAASPAPLPKPTTQGQFIDPNTGGLSQYGEVFLNLIISRINGGNRVIPTNATGTNVITLTPLDASPLLDKYNDFDTFGFVAENNTTGSVTMTVVPKTGTLSTLKAYVDNGGTQAGSGDLTAGRQYFATFCDSLDSAVGGFVIR